MATKRHLAAIMFTDIVGFSAMMQSDEQMATVVRTRHKDIFKEVHEEFGGEILQYFGDGTLSIFRSTVAAIECAVAMQIEFQQAPEVPLRIGIHTGDISYDEDGAFGDGLNIASRIEKLCVPGGVFISAKAYDDIKNHSWLEALSLGLFQLRNIFQDIEIYAVSSKGLPIPDPDVLQQYPESKITYPGDPDDFSNKSKKRAALLALFLGFFGVHRFYLGQTARGVIQFILAVITFMISVSEGVPIFLVIALIGFIDAVLLFAMSSHDFNRKYNSIKTKKSKQKRKEIRERVRPARASKSTGRMKKESLLQKGIQEYREENYKGALGYFEQALEKEPNKVAIQFNMACCYSALRESDKAFAHLEEAVAKGMEDTAAIHNHEGLSYIRRLAEFENFVKNGYRHISQLPPAQESIIKDFGSFDPEILDKIEDLGERLESGELSKEEFELRKQEILKREE